MKVHKCRASSVLLVVIAAGLLLPGCVTRQRADKALSHQKMGLVYFDEGDFPGAVGELRESIRLNPHHHEAHHLLASCYFAMGLYDEAGKEYQIATRLQPSFPEAWVNWGALLVAQERWEEALQKLKVAEADPTYRETGRANHNMGWAYYNLGKYDEARECYQRVLDVTPRFCPSVHNMALVAEAEGKLDEAEERYLQAKDCNELDLNNWLRLGRLYMRLDRPEDAKYYLDFVAAHDEGGDLGEEATQLLDELGS